VVGTAGRRNRPGRDYEKEDYFDFRWWRLSAVVGSRHRFYPRDLATLLGAFLAGEQIDEPFELWS